MFESPLGASLAHLKFWLCHVSATNFRAAIHRALEARSGEKNAEVFAFLPAKAGSGATTTALFVTNILSEIAGRKVLLLECDLHAGPVSMLFNIRPEYSILEALENSHRLTDENWKQLTTKLGGIDVLPSMSQQGVRQVSPWAYQRLLAFARRRYDLVLCDLPEVVNDATEVVVRAAKAVVVVTTPSVPSLRLAARRRDDLEARGVGAANVKYVLNQKLCGRTASVQEGRSAFESGSIAAIPLDENLFDASEFKPSIAKPQTLAECVKIAEFCIGKTIDSGKRQQPKRKFFARGWLRLGSRTPELSIEPAGR